MNQILKIFSLFLLSGLFLFSSCTTTESSGWWESPPQEDLKLKGYIGAFIGSAKIYKDLSGKALISQARMDAEASGRKAVAAYMGARIRSLAEYLNKEMGDALNPNSIVNYVSEQRVSQQLIKEAVELSIPLRYHTDSKDNIQYVLIGLMGPKFMENFSQAISTNIDKMLPKKEKEVTPQDLDAMKNDARKRLDELLKKESEKINQNPKDLPPK